VRFGSDDARLLPLGTAAVEVTALDEAAALLAPNEAMRPAGNRWTCRVRGAGGEVSERLVERGASDGKLVQIRAGLSEGEELVFGEAQP
jgi:macrolide-specific efflux system membrane fusion protein